MDMNAICNALAARFAPGTIGTPTGAEAMRYAYGQAPNNLPATPSVVVLPEDGQVVANPGQWRFEHNIDVLFYLAKAPGDTARVETQRQLWLPTLLAATQGQAKLGVSGVDKALPTEWEFTELPFGGDEYHGIRINYRVWVTETVTLTP